MKYSQNGWSATPSLIASFTVPGTQVRVALRKGDSSVILLELMRRFNAEVQSLRQKDTGGYNPRSIIDSRTLSNHASGTAVDLRWNDHPMGARGTFTAQQRATILRILRDLEGVVRWGGNYTGRKDEMHFEINASASAVKRVADKIRNGKVGKPIPKPPALTVKNGLTNGQAKTLQTEFNRQFPAYKDTPLARDGIVGPKTISAIKEFQRRTGLEPDGIVGPKTRAMLRKYHINV